MIVRGALDRRFEPLHQLRAECRIVADQLEPDALLHQSIELALEIVAHQRRQVGDLAVATLPVLRRESVERKHLDAMIGGRLERALDRLGAGAMPGDAGQTARFGPAAVAVHDDGDVARNGARAGLGDRLGSLGSGSGHLPRISCSLVAASASISLIVSSVSFCTSCSSRLRSSSLISCFRSSVLRWSIPSRRTLRTATRAFSAYWPTSLASSLRRSSVSSGIGRRMIWPSTIGLMPSPALRIAFSTGWTFDRSHTWTDSSRASGVDTVGTWLSGMLLP